MPLFPFCSPVINVVRDPYERNHLRQVLDSIQWTFESQSQETEEIDNVVMAMKAYNDYKIKYKENIRFDPKAKNFGK